ncbi:radical SAM/SPASM domain-containing protein [Salidesulfovibrio onnuriiensis]|uniref:radical SAM/SPASM domain-containing protein n=1 Tax=Salidesulfovibrio onnuriiensis TaxID=2583823 RepID=UPI0011CCA3DF|nr:radical SAM/SPASM domain-containing protein [Salidesulfovibrio onnuriiensis]
MLRVFHEREKKQLHFTLDIPIPEEVTQHPELETFLRSFSQNGGTVKTGPAGDIESLTIGIDDWGRLIRDNLSGQKAEFQLSILTQLLDSDAMELGNGLQVNFHQNPFDTPQRYWNFIFNQGHFTLYFFNRVNWYMAPKNQIVTPFPLHVDIETASTCNMDCPMCYRRGLKHTGQMAPELFRKAVDECAREGVFSIRLSWRGETLTHPRIKELIQYACERIPNVSFLTNAFYISQEMAECFVDAGLSYLAVSFDGIGEIYEKVRHPAKFKENWDRLALLKNTKIRKGVMRPQVRLCTIWPAIKNAPEAYYDTMSPVSDYIVCNPYINFMGPMKLKPDFICQYPWERLVIAYDGSTQCCTGWNAADVVIGNIKETSLKEMWTGQAMERIRTLHATGERLSLNSCAECRHGSKGDENVSIDEILERRW